MHVVFVFASQPVANFLGAFCGVWEQVAVVLLVMFFFYDIFMVFLSPWLFQSSVMMDVATAGMPVAVDNQACYCRLNPGMCTLQVARSQWL